MDQLGDKKAFYRSVKALVIPVALQYLITFGMQNAGVLMLGRMNEADLSASSLAGQIQFVMNYFLVGLSSGSLVMASQYWGKGDKRTIEKIMAMAIKLSIGVSLLFMVAALAMPKVLMGIFSPDAAVQELGAQYLRIVAPGYLCMALTNIYLNIMRSAERAMVATAVYFSSLVVNVALSAVLIFGLFGIKPMGIRGAAIALLTARITEVLIVIVYALRNKVLRLRAKDFIENNKVLFGDLIRYAGPATANEVLWGGAMAVFAAIVGHLGAAAVAAYSVSQIVRQLTNIPGIATGHAATVLVGKTLGSGKVQQAEVEGKKLIKLSIILGLVGGVLVLVLRPLIPLFLNLSAEAERYLSGILIILSAYIVLQVVNSMLVVGINRAGGDTRFGMFLDGICLWVVIIPLALLGGFVFRWPVEVVFIILFADEFIKTPFCIWRYRKKMWMKNITREEQAGAETGAEVEAP